MGTFQTGADIQLNLVLEDFEERCELSKRPLDYS